MSFFGKKQPEAADVQGAAQQAGAARSNAFICNDDGTAADPSAQGSAEGQQELQPKVQQEIHQDLHDVAAGGAAGQEASLLQEDDKPGCDWALFLFAVMILGIGLIMVLSASGIVANANYHDKYYFFRKQVLHAGIGFVFLFAAARVSLRLLYTRVAMYSLLGLSVLLLLLTLSPLAPVINGAHRWLKLGPVTVQPVEFVKIAVALYLAFYMSDKQSMIKSFSRGMLAPCIVTAVCGILLIMQPDFGSVMVLACLFGAMCLVGGTRMIYIGGMVLAVVVVAVLAVYSADYRMDRVVAFLDPFDPTKPAAYQLKQSLLAIGSGSFFGVGIGASRQKLFYLPEAHNDFIMAVLAEEVGFLGVSVVMLLFALFFWRCYRIIQGQEVLRDRLSAFAITLILALPVCMNLAVVMGAVPTKGVPLPFMSYGGSNLVSYMICVGLLLNFSRKSRYGMKKKEDGGTGDAPLQHLFYLDH